MPSSLVTGGAGFIGCHVSRELVRMGHRVVVLDDLSGGFLENVPAGARFVPGSILDTDLLARLFEEHRFDHVYHLAAYAAEGLSHFIRRFNYQNNLIGSVNLINEAIRHEVRRFVYASSIAVYGSIPPPMREDDVPAPEDPYGIAKLAVEHDLRAARRQFGLSSTVFRLHNVYGECQNLGDPYRNVIAIFMRQLLQGERPTVFGDGEQSRSFSYVGDVAPCIARAVDVEAARDQVFNLGAERPCTVNELARHVMTAMDVHQTVRHLPPRHEVLHAHACHEKARRLLGAEARTPLGEGLARMAAWARRAGIRTTPAFEDIEVDMGLPEAWREKRTLVH